MIPMTFHRIEDARGIAYCSKKDSPLTDWYDRVRDVPLGSFQIEDLCKSIRQNLYLEYVVPFALAALESNPLAGEMYDGELVMAFTGVRDDFWRENHALGKRIAGVLNDVVIDRLSKDLNVAPEVITKLRNLAGG